MMSPFFVPQIKLNPLMTNTLKKYLNNLLESLPMAIITSCISVLILTNIDAFKEFDLKIVLSSFAVTVLVMSHLVKPFTRILARI